MLMLTVSDAEEIIHQTKAWNLDGLISCNLQPDVIDYLYALCQKPLVSLDAYLEDREAYINIATDDFDGGYQVGRHLAEMGHRDILMVSDNDQGVDHHRWLGLKKALRDAGISVSDERHLIVSNLYEERLVQFRKNKRLFQKQTALFFSSDYYALEAFSILRDMGFRIPEDLSLVGFDDLFCTVFVTPRLTTVRQNIEQKAKMTVDALFSLLNQEERQKWILPVELVKRESVEQIRRA